MTDAVPMVAGYSDLVPIGRGGFSAVYRANHQRLGRVVALKVLHTDIQGDDDRRRVDRECRVGGRVSGHPNIATVLETGVTADGRPFIASTYYADGSLADRLRTQGPLPAEDVVAIGVKLAATLAYLHSVGVMHRDIKPQNILISEFGEPALADFGVAAIVHGGGATTATGALTPLHAPPESFDNTAPAPAGDIFSLGSTLYTLLVGRAPFQGEPGDTVLGFLRRLLEQPVPPMDRPDVPAAVEEALRRAMAKDPAARFATGLDFAEALRAAQSVSGWVVTPVGLGPDTIESIRADASRRAAVAAVAAGVADVALDDPTLGSGARRLLPVLPPTISGSLPSQRAIGAEDEGVPGADSLSDTGRVEVPRPAPADAASTRRRTVVAVVAVAVLVLLVGVGSAVSRRTAAEVASPEVVLSTGTWLPVHGAQPDGFAPAAVAPDGSLVTRVIDGPGSGSESDGGDGAAPASTAKATPGGATKPSGVGTDQQIRSAGSGGSGGGSRDGSGGAANTTSTITARPATATSPVPTSPGPTTAPAALPSAPTTKSSTPVCGPLGVGPFIDVPGSSAACADIEWMVGQGIADGYPDGSFLPLSSATRQATASFLYRLRGASTFTPPTTPTFVDVALTHPFFKEIEWMTARGMTDGYPDGTFRPAIEVTRQSMAAFLYRFAGSPGFAPPAVASFSDVPSAAPFFKEIEWLVGQKYAGGFGDGTYRPGTVVSRQEMATTLHRLFG